MQTMLHDFFLVRCLRCGQKNRIVREHLASRSLCGRCGAHLDEIIIHCLECGTRNLIPEEKLADQPLCGKCHARLYQASIVSVDDSSFESEITSFPGPVIVWVGSPGCESYETCIDMLNRIASRYAGGIKIARLQRHDNEKTIARYRISETTALLVFNNGALHSTFDGTVSREDIDHHIAMILKEDRNTG